MAYDTQPGGTGPGPVTDWANDWDWLDDQWGARAPEIWAELREQGCPVAFTERYGRAFMPITHEAVSAIAHDTEHYSSFRVSVALPDSPVRKAPPITTDPPDHTDQRRLLLAAFSPRQVVAKEEPTREFCRSLIAQLDGRDLADAAVDYAQHIPVHVIAEMIGVPESDAEVFRDWVFRNFQLAPRDNEVKAALQTEMIAYFSALLDARAADPRDDLATVIVNAEIDGEPVGRDLQVGYLILLILAGVDTTWSAIGSGLYHFATHPEDRDRLAGLPHDDPRWAMAMEEVLRFYSPVTMARMVVADTEVSGCPVRHGEQVLLPFPAANRDPAVFERSDEFVIDRAANRHAAFGLGIHRCLGSNLARMELLCAFQEWLAAFPRYSLDDRGPVTWANGQVRGPRSVPVRLNR